MLQRAITVHGIAIGIPDDLFAQAEAIADRFSLTDSSTEIETTARFVEFAAAENADVAVAAFQHIHQTYCSANNIHVIVQQLGLSAEQARTVLKGYYSVWNLLESRQLLPHVPIPAIFADGSVRLAAMFGGQGGMDNYLDEAARLLDVYRPLISDFVRHMSDFLKRESADPLLVKAHSQLLDIAGWLEFPESVPDVDYLLATPVAMPALGLVQAMHVAVLYKTLNMSPGDLLSHFKVAIGHSQGVTMAAAFASVTDEASFYAATERALGILLTTSAIVQLESSSSTSHAGALGSTLSSGDPPSPMILVRGHSQDILQAFIAEFNADHTDDGARVSLALINGRSTFVVAGNPEPVAYFEKFLSKRTVLPTADQSQIRFSQRKPIAEVSPLSISAPYHCDLQLASASKVHEFVISKGWVLHAEDLRIPINGGKDGSDLRDEPDLTNLLVYCMCVHVVNWPVTVHSANATHIVDVSPGGFSIFGKFSRDAVEGTGTSVISASSLIAYSKSRMGSRADIYKQDITDVFSIPNWLDAYGPQIVRTTHDSQLHVHSPMSLALGLPPVMVAGMTPITSNEHFVAAISNAGYHVELAGGGIYNEKIFREKVDKLVQLLDPGCGFSVNTIYMNQKQWSFQYPAILRMRLEGVPITGLCIGAGVPSLEVANSIIASLRDVGIQHVALKPGSVATIRQSVKIAEANPDFPVIIQWTGGRAGGHHSNEDIHQPILETYNEIRLQKNIVLIIGSGFGDAEGSIPYITGDWSLCFGCAPMPFDGILVASRVMVAKEAGPSDEAKELLVRTLGVPDTEWENAYDGTAGGVMSVQSGYREMAHVISTRAAHALKTVNELIFSKPYAEQLPLVQANRDLIIKLLNDDYLRPWFGRKDDGRVAELKDMTYLEVINRLVDLLYIKGKECWLDTSQRRLFGEFISRVEERHAKAETTRVFQREEQLDTPSHLVERVRHVYPDMETMLITPGDAKHLVWLCKRSGTKPVPFVPVLDSDLHTWMTKDTEWQYENLDSVVDRDVQRTTIAFGPVAAKYATIANEPVKDILDGINNGLIAAIVDRDYHGDLASIPEVECISSSTKQPPPPPSVSVVCDDPCLTYTLPDDPLSLPDRDQWLQILAGSEKCWLHALLTSKFTVRGSLYTENAIRRVLYPMPSQTVSVALKNGIPERLSAFGPDNNMDVDVSIGGSRRIHVTIIHRIEEKVFALNLFYQYEPSMPASPIIEIRDGHDDQLRQLFLQTNMVSRHGFVGLCSTENGDAFHVTCEPFAVTDSVVTKFCGATSNNSLNYRRSTGGQKLAPIDLLLPIVWPGLVSLLSTAPFHVGLLDIVHQYNSYQLVDGTAMLRVGDIVHSDVALVSVVNTSVGRQMTFRAQFFRDDRLFANLDCMIVARDNLISQDQMFRYVDEPVAQVAVKTANDASLLRSKEWFIVTEDPEPFVLAPGQVLEFRLKSEYRYQTDKLYSHISTSGSVHLVLPHGDYKMVASVNYRNSGVYGNPVVEYLHNNSFNANEPSHFGHGGHPISPANGDQRMVVNAPLNNWGYANASGDHNIIHTNSYIANYVGLPGTICHGMWTSATTRAFIEQHAAGGNPSRVRSYKVEFSGMVLPGDILETRLHHVGMRDGRMLIEGKTTSQYDDTVLLCSAEIEQPKTAYFFTGQGSQFVGMGMDLYETSAAAREVWNRAEKHMLETYGVSLLTIARTNPKQYIVKFGGKNGSAVRSNYLSLTRMVNGECTQLLPGITHTSSCYVHHSENGLLNTTLFTQPIQTVMALAQVADMRAYGLIQHDCVFAGHSLGEFAALFAIAQIGSIEDAIDITFYRGLLHYTCTDRDENGCSKYAMVSVNPQKVGHGFCDKDLEEIIRVVRGEFEQLLEVVNYNIRGAQYAVTGRIESLVALGYILDDLASNKITRTHQDYTCSLREHTAIRKKSALPPVLSRGISTTIIPGIDVPFHSSVLSADVHSLRELIQQKIPRGSSLPLKLVGRYIPNVIGKPFGTSHDYVERVFDACKSYAVAEIMENQEYFCADDQVKNATLARTLLIELLATQYAAPVQWIDTQETAFQQLAVQRVIEVGPKAILSAIAKQTISNGAWYRNPVAVYHASQDADHVYYQDNTVAEPVGDGPSCAQENIVAATPASVAPIENPVEHSKIERNASARAVQIDDVPISSLDILHFCAAQKLGKKIDGISVGKSIKELVAGKSNIQNELIGNFQKEFPKGLPDHTEELPLLEVAKRLGPTRDTLGKYSSSLVQQLFTRKSSGEFPQSAARAYLATTYGLGAMRQDAILLLATTCEPPSRLVQAESAKSWLDSIVLEYASHVNISLSKNTGGSSHGTLNSARVAIGSVEFEMARQEQRNLVLQQIGVLSKHIGQDMRHDGRISDEKDKRISLLENEHKAIVEEFGNDLLQGSQPIFDAKKARVYNSYWNWARQDALSWIHDVLTGKLVGRSDAAYQKRVHLLKNRSTPELVKMLGALVAKMQGSDDSAVQKAYELATDLYNACKDLCKAGPIYKELTQPLGPHTEIAANGELVYTEVPRANERTFADYVRNIQQRTANMPPAVYMCDKLDGTNWVHSESISNLFYSALDDIATSGIPFTGKVALITGCGKGSIGSGLIEALLAGGARVIATTSNYSLQSIRFFENIYRQYGARGSELILVPFNQSSSLDVNALIDYIYSDTGLQCDPDYILPFAAFPEHGKDALSADSKSDLTIRILLTNLFRLMGRVRQAKIAKGGLATPSLVVLPHSANHGTLGYDGLYGETKAALLTLYNRWYAESWSDYISITGGEIGLTRNTNLSYGNLYIYEGIEEKSVRTFSREDMTFTLVGLLHPTMVELSYVSPVFGHFNGGIWSIKTMKQAMQSIRESIYLESATKRITMEGLAADSLVEVGEATFSAAIEKNTLPRAQHKVEYPVRTPYDQLGHLRHLQGMVNLDKVVVVTGFGEVGPFGNAALRWEMEAYGEFSLEGCIELAWIMGLIKHFAGEHPITGEHYIGWVDAKTNEPVRDIDVKAKYEPYILEHTGIRLLEPEIVDGPDYNWKPIIQEMLVTHDFEPFETSAEDAAKFKHNNSEKVDIWANANGTWSVRFLKGAVVFVPKAMKFDNIVAAQIPLGWDPKRYGIPDDVLESVGFYSCYGIVSTVEAMVKSGITDPYELYQYFHVSEVGLSVGSYQGGLSSFKKTFKGRWTDMSIRSESIVETGINVMGAWINMLLLSASGPFKCATGACATSAMTLDIAVETIQSGKARVMITGTSDEYSQEMAHEFGQLGATINNADDISRGRFPEEHSRPCTTTRNGFVEGYGSGIAILMSASAAIEMGVPIYGIIAVTATASDKEGRNAVAPGQGLLTFGRGRATAEEPKLLDIHYRRKMMDRQLAQVDGFGDMADTQQLRKCVQTTWGNDFWKMDKSISPLQGALATWGLNADDIDMASFHGTSTQLNEKNESDIISRLMKQLNRTPNLPLPVVCQKGMIGHPKAASALCMLDGILQSMGTGLLPGNRNADSIDNKFEQFESLVYLSQTLQVPKVKAALLTSFGIGQANGGALIVHPDYLLATLTKDELESYHRKVGERQLKSTQYWQETLVGDHTFVQPKNAPPYTPEQEPQIYMDVDSRARYDPLTETYHF